MEPSYWTLPTWMDGVRFLRQLKEPQGTVRIALVGKYVLHQDAYKSICESFILAGAANGVEVKLDQILSDDITPENVESLLGDVSGILVAPGFGERGIAGKVEAIRFARENNVPFFGICLGMQCAVIEFARNVCGWKTAHSTEFNAKTSHPVIDLMEEQKAISEKGGTMRLGAYTCKLEEGSKVSGIYGRKVVKERHRHRYELNNVLRYKLAESGMLFTGVNPKRDLVEIIELPDLRFFIGVQFHPEYKSTVGNPHPLFNAFVRACVEHATDTNSLEKPKGPNKKKNRHLASAKM